MIRQATITAVLPDDRLRLSFKPTPDETIEVVVERPAYADVKVGSRIDVDWDRERGITRVLWPSIPSPTAVTAGHTIATTAAPPKQPIVTSVLSTFDQPTATAEVLGCFEHGYLIEYMDGPLHAMRDTVLVAEGMNVGKVKSGYIVTVRDPGNRARIIAAHDPEDVTESEPSFGVRVRMALGFSSLGDDAVLAAIRDHKLLAECEREILAALGMPETHTVRDVADAAAELRRELGIDASATWDEIVSAVKDTEAAWEVAQRQRADVCKALGIAEGSSFAELLAEAENNAELVKLQGAAMHEAVKQLRQWSGIRDGEIDESELPDEVDRLRRELLRCSGAHVRGSRSIVDGLREVAAEAYVRAMARDRLKLGTVANKAIGSYEIGVNILDKPARVWITVDAVTDPSEVMRALLYAISNSHRPCAVLLTVHSDAGKLELTLPPSSVPGEEGWS